MMKGRSEDDDGSEPSTPGRKRVGSAGSGGSLRRHRVVAEELQSQQVMSPTPARGTGSEAQTKKGKGKSSVTAAQGQEQLETRRVPERMVVDSDQQVIEDLIRSMNEVMQGENPGRVLASITRRDAAGWSEFLVGAQGPGQGPSGSEIPNDHRLSDELKEFQAELVRRAQLNWTSAVSELMSEYNTEKDRQRQHVHGLQQEMLGAWSSLRKRTQLMEQATRIEEESAVKQAQEHALSVVRTERNREAAAVQMEKQRYEQVVQDRVIQLESHANQKFEEVLHEQKNTKTQLSRMEKLAEAETGEYKKWRLAEQRMRDSEQMLSTRVMRMETQSMTEKGAEGRFREMELEVDLRIRKMLEENRVIKAELNSMAELADKESGACRMWMLAEQRAQETEQMISARMRELEERHTAVEVQERTRRTEYKHEIQERDRALEEMAEELSAWHEWGGNWDEEEQGATPVPQGLASSPVVHEGNGTREGTRNQTEETPSFTQPVEGRPSASWSWMERMSRT